jgi:hypothetical protein
MRWCSSRSWRPPPSATEHRRRRGEPDGWRCSSPRRRCPSLSSSVPVVVRRCWRRPAPGARWRHRAWRHAAPLADRDQGGTPRLQARVPGVHRGGTRCWRRPFSPPEPPAAFGSDPRGPGQAQIIVDKTAGPGSGRRGLVTSMSACSVFVEAPARLHLGCWTAGALGGGWRSRCAIHTSLLVEVALAAASRRRARCRASGGRPPVPGASAGPRRRRVVVHRPIPTADSAPDSVRSRCGAVLAGAASHRAHRACTVGFGPASAIGTWAFALGASSEGGRRRR